MSERDRGQKRHPHHQSQRRIREPASIARPSAGDLAFCGKSGRRPPGRAGRERALVACGGGGGAVPAFSDPRHGARPRLASRPGDPAAAPLSRRAGVEPDRGRPRGVRLRGSNNVGLGGRSPLVAARAGSRPARCDARPRLVRHRRDPCLLGARARRSCFRCCERRGTGSARCRHADEPAVVMCRSYRRR